MPRTFERRGRNHERDDDRVQAAIDVARRSRRFILVGGVAATAHGSARLTQDLDIVIVYDREPENIDRLVKALEILNPYPRGAPPGLPFLWDRETIHQGLNFTLSTTAGDIDLLGEIVGGGSFSNLQDHTVTLHIYGIQCLCLDLETLIHVKRAAGRPKDFEAIAELELIWNEQANGDPDH